MKTKSFLLSLLIGFVTIISAIYFAIEDKESAKNYLINMIYSQRIKEYHTIVNDKKEFLKSFAYFLANSKEIKEAYLENNRTKIINFVMPLYKALYPKHIEEIHFFKPPAISFVNFANLKVFNVDVSKARNDILWITTSKKPSVHFYVCRLYPGLRATYPILYHGKLLGMLSFGIHISNILSILRKLDSKNVTLYLNDELLKHFLLSKNYKQYSIYPLYKGYRVIGKKFDIHLHSGVELKNASVFTKIKIKDFFGNTFGYLVIEDDFTALAKRMHTHIKHLIYVGIIATIMGIGVIHILFFLIRKRLIEHFEIIDKIKKREFDKLPKRRKPKDLCDEYKNSLIDLGEEIKAFYNVLSDKIVEYEKKVYKDVLTGCLNRNFLEEKSKELLLKLKLHYPLTGVIMIDIDDFKKINDKYGHDVGDLVLINLAKEIRKIIRKNDFFIRYGGEEFLIILPNSDIEATIMVAEKIREKIEKTPVKISDSKFVKYTISVGVSNIREQDETIFEAIKRADEKLYHAKRNGKNRVEF